MDKSRIAGGVVAALVVGALGFVVAGCGSSSASPPATTTTTTSASTTATGTGRFNSAAFQKYQSCLKAHGVTLPQFNRRPGTGGQTRTFTGPRTFTAPPGTGTSTTQQRSGGFAGRSANLTPAQRKAAQACQSVLPKGSVGFGQGGRRTGGGASGAAVAKYTQCLAKHGVKFGQSGQSSAAFTKAQTACRSLLPRPTTTSGTTTTTG
ncbi:MAG TPA: hypothetical protein VGL84_08790 [Gaiellaceae bacterium]